MGKEGVGGGIHRVPEMHLPMDTGRTKTTPRIERTTNGQRHGSPTGRCRCLGWRVPMINALLALALLLALGAAVELCIKVAFVCLLPLLLRLP